MSLIKAPTPMPRKRKPYLYLCRSVNALVQYVALSLLSPKYWKDESGYYYFSVGQIPVGKDPLEVDRKLIQKYGIATTTSQRWTMKRRGLARLCYLRLDRTFIVLATEGHHPTFWREEKGRLRNIRTGKPLIIWGYSISVKKNGKTKVAMSKKEYERRRDWFVAEAVRRRDREWFERKLWNFPFAPYSAVRTQLFSIVRAINAKRKLASLPLVRWEKAVRTRRRSEKVFQDAGYLPSSPHGSFANVEKRSNVID